MIIKVRKTICRDVGPVEDFCCKKLQKFVECKFGNIYSDTLHVDLDLRSGYSYGGHDSNYSIAMNFGLKIYNFCPYCGTKISVKEVEDESNMPLL